MVPLPGATLEPVFAAQAADRRPLEPAIAKLDLAPLAADLAPLTTNLAMLDTAPRFGAAGLVARVRECT